MSTNGAPEAIKVENVAKSFGAVTALVDLSIAGAQVVSPAILRPNQRVRITLGDHTGTLRFNATVAWAAFEMPPKSGPQYRAGLEFVDADVSAVDAFCARHGVTADPGTRAP